jgi:hypothetical protein
MWTADIKAAVSQEVTTNSRADTRIQINGFFTSGTSTGMGKVEKHSCKTGLDTWYLILWFLNEQAYKCPYISVLVW